MPEYSGSRRERQAMIGSDKGSDVANNLRVQEMTYRLDAAFKEGVVPTANEAQISATTADKDPHIANKPSLTTREAMNIRVGAAVDEGVPTPEEVEISEAAARSLKKLLPDQRTALEGPDEPTLDE